MVDVERPVKGLVDLSFMPSLECDLRCPHCMYDSSPDNKARLDYTRVREWVSTVRWEDVNAVGFYGGEPSLLLVWYSQFVHLVPSNVPKFIITNGTWSRDRASTAEFLRFCRFRGLQVVVSGTRWHRPYQDVSVLERLAADGEVTYKGEERELIPMGAAAAWVPNHCSEACQRWTKPWRVALHPTRDVIFQSCDGSYPHLQTLDEPFAEVVPNIERLLGRARARTEPQCLPYQPEVAGGAA